MNVQAPPNLSPQRDRAVPARRNQRLGRHLAAQQGLRQSRGAVAASRTAGASAARGPAFDLRERLAIYPEYINDEWVDPAMRPAIARLTRSSSSGGLIVNLEHTAQLMSTKSKRRRSSALMDKASPAVRAALKRVSTREELTPEEGLLLYTATGDDLRAVIKCADLARAEDVGDEVTYVVNRNINFTNICFVGCQFCGFKRQRWESDAYDHSDETILAKVADAVARGATEVCMQGGINPDMPPFKYRDLLDAIKGALSRDSHPRVLADGDHVRRAARADGVPGVYRDAARRRSRLDSRHRGRNSRRQRARDPEPQESRRRRLGRYHHHRARARRADHFDDHVRPRRKSAPRRQSSRTCCATSRSSTHGFTEFVPLRFIHENTVLFRKGLVSPPPNGHARLPDVRVLAPVPARADRQSPDLVGQARRRSRRADAEGRMQRFLRHADGGKHHGAGRRRLAASSSRST